MSAYIKRFIREHPDAVLVPVCPEILGGRGVPRAPVKRRRGHVYETCEDKERRPEVTGADVTIAFEMGARRTLNIARLHLCNLAILCKWSPSCDVTGITGKLLAADGIKIINTF